MIHKSYSPFGGRILQAMASCPAFAQTAVNILGQLYKLVVKRLLSALLCILFISCFKDLNCINLRNDVVQIAFKKEKTGEADALVLDTVVVADLVPGSPYVFKKGQNAIDRINVPLNPVKNKQKIQFTISDVSEPVLRTLELGYEVKAQFESKDCEPKFLFYDLTVAQHDFIAVKVVNATPSQTIGQIINIEVTYR